MLDFALPKGTASPRGNRQVGTVAAANEAIKAREPITGTAARY